MRNSLIYMLLLVTAFSLWGCSDPEDSELPWAKPASWEGTPAGMGNIKQQGGAPRY